MHTVHEVTLYGITLDWCVVCFECGFNYRDHFCFPRIINSFRYATHILNALPNTTEPMLSSF